MARAMLVGSKVSGFPMTRTPSRAMATVWQSVQLAAATAALVASTVDPSVCTILRARANTFLPSVVLLATAALSVLAPGVVGVVLAEVVEVEVSAVLDDRSGTSPSANAQPPMASTMTATAARPPARRLKVNDGSFTEPPGGGR